MLRRRWLAILAPALIVVGVALAFAEVSASNLEPKYEATQRLAANSERGYGTGSLEQLVIEVNDGAVGDQAKDALPDGLRATVKASVLASIGVIEVRAVALDRADAVTAATVYGDTIIDSMNGADRLAFTEQLSQLTEEFGRAAAEVDLLQVAVFGNPDDAKLVADRDTALSRYRTAQDAVRAVETQGLPEAQLRTLAQARATEVPAAGFVGMPLPRQIAMALVVGLVVGLAVAFLLEAIDRRLEGPSSTSVAFGVPVLAEVPHGGNAFAKAHEIAPTGSMVMEAYRRLRTIIQLEREASEHPRTQASVILVASGSPAEGKTVTSAHLAVALGEIGAKVLLVSADFRRPALHKYFDVDPSGGIASLATAGPTAETDLVKPTGFRGVRLITAGSGTQDPTDLIYHAQRVVNEARDICDYVIIDTSPLLVANDALDFVKQSDVVILVSRFRKTTTPAAHRTRDMLFQTGAPVLGVISTGVSGGEGYGLYYGADYRSSDEPSEARVVARG